LVLSNIVRVLHHELLRGHGWIRISLQVLMGLQSCQRSLQARFDLRRLLIYERLKEIKLRSAIAATPKQYHRAHGGARQRRDRAHHQTSMSVCFGSKADILDMSDEKFITMT
jgi:hypothetical protein